ncbi:hypothetical protein GJU40_13200 [Bacillus lacus]|uniref:Uncharacterized protein n=1 Tax=Metabacillus lacus TaxID=1983721 RepID=A0A7X2M0Q5_9BACI|nr:hypothetical protein [Metabacillus lacus]MRX73099.1 hypothetical protein [Metabacillus lacus]
MVSYGYAAILEDHSFKEWAVKGSLTLMSNSSDTALYFSSSRYDIRKQMTKQKDGGFDFHIMGDKQSGSASHGIELDVKLSAGGEEVHFQLRLGGIRGLAVMENMLVYHEQYYLHNNLLSGTLLVKDLKRPPQVLIQSAGGQEELVEARYKEDIPFSSLQRWEYSKTLPTPELFRSVSVIS